ncbi:MAG: hypothetical protein ACRCUT_08255, partial [Spirochaetota bacterium]
AMAHGDSYAAISILEKIAPLMADAEKTLVQVRISLAGEVASLEKEGIAAYERKDYKNCIVIMKKVSVIDPENRTAKIYLPRARKRAEALEKLK